MSVTQTDAELVARSRCGISASGVGVPFKLLRHRSLCWRSIVRRLIRGGRVVKLLRLGNGTRPRRRSLRQMVIMSDNNGLRPKETMTESALNATNVGGVEPTARCRRLGASGSFSLLSFWPHPPKFRSYREGAYRHASE